MRLVFPLWETPKISIPRWFGVEHGAAEGGVVLRLRRSRPIFHPDDEYF